MNLPVATTPQVLALARTTKADEHVVLVRARPVWDGPNQIELGTRTVTLVAASTVLAVRSAIAARGGADLLVVLTDREEPELGLDVLARVSRQHVRRLDPWELVRSELGVSAFDPLLATDRWILDALVQHKPTDGWIKPPSGFLSRDEAVRQLVERWLQLPAGSSLVDLLSWLGSAGAADKLLQTSDTIRSGVRTELLRRFPEPASLLLDLAVGGSAGDLVPLGLATRVLWAGSTEAGLIAARVRFEPLIGGNRLTETTARAWATAAEGITRDVLEANGRSAIDPWLGRAEQIIRNCEAISWCSESSVLAAGLNQRFDQAGALLQGVISGDHAQLAALVAVLAGIEQHMLATEDPHRVDTLRAAVRLARRIAAPSTDVAAPTLPAQSVHYRDDGAWVDRARHVVRQGDRAPGVAAAYSSLLELVDAEREAINRFFAEQLRQWSLGEPGTSADLVPLERVLTDVVAPVAALGPVLLVVADGMSWPVAAELLDDLRDQGWVRLESDRPTPIGVALLPTVTEASRTSLLCGQRVTGDAITEATGFSSHTALKAVGGPAPVIFHKARLATAGGEALDPTLRAALLDPNQRIVGVVINAIDDHLSRGMQVRVEWTTNTVVPLRELLAEAAAGGRTVVLTSDHGHVLDERRSVQRGIADPGERWRTAATPAGDEEILLTGPRVLMGGGSVVVPTSDTLRYGPSKHGYHGGVTPQEVLVPVLVLARATSMPAGWGPAGDQAPSWWSGQAEGAEVGLTPVPPPTLVAKPVKPVATGQVGLFDEEAPPLVETVAPTAGPAWLAALFGSATFDNRRPILTKRKVNDEQVARVLIVLDQRGGSALRSVLAADVGVPEFRLNGLLTVLAMAVNLEGYPVLEVRDDTVMLNRALLLTQFGITE